MFSKPSLLTKVGKWRPFCCSIWKSTTPSFPSARTTFIAGDCSPGQCVKEKITGLEIIEVRIRERAVKKQCALLGFRHVEGHHRDDDLPVGVGRISAHAAVARLALRGGSALEVRVLADRSLHGLEHAREVDVAIEDDDRDRK